MARPAFKSEKRKKELQRLKKQEEKRQKRLNKGSGSQPGGEIDVIIDADGNVIMPEQAEQTEQTETPTEPAASEQK